ncbi:MAG: DUF2190 family protein [bacterium]|nr:DUF2190 family protein [bacterium]
MAQNFRKSGDTITMIAPTGGVVAGVGYVIGDRFVIAAFDTAAGEPFEGHTLGEWDLPKDTSILAAGVKVYWKNASMDKEVGTQGNGRYLIGTTTAAAASGDATARVRLDGIAVTAETA